MVIDLVLGVSKTKNKQKTISFKEIVFFSYIHIIKMSPFLKKLVIFYESLNFTFLIFFYEKNDYFVSEFVFYSAYICCS